MSYNLRMCKSVTYKDAVALPRAGTRVVRKDDTLYPIDVLDRKEDCVLIHYVGYDSKHDEWRPKKVWFQQRKGNNCTDPSICTQN